MLSIPPASITLADPATSMSLANIAARIPEPHILLIVTAPVESGNPALRIAWRAGAWPWPAIRQLPNSTSSMESSGTLARSTAALIATAPSSHAASDAKSPSMPPIGVRAAETMTMDSLMERSFGGWTRRWRGGDQRARRALVDEPFRRFVREDVVDVAGEDAVLASLPEIAVEEVGVVRHEHLAHVGVAEQEGGEGLGEHVGRGQVLDRVAVFDHRVLDLLARRVVQVDVERDHAPLDVEVADDDQIALFLEQAGAFGLQRREQRLAHPLARERDAAVFERVGHPADPVVRLDDLVLALDLRARGLLLRREEVLDHLEDERERRQAEHQHHHALDPGGIASICVEIEAETGLRVFAFPKL